MGFNRNLGNIPEVIKESGGKIGIGNSIPIRKLEVASDGANWISGTFSGTGNTDKVVIGNLTTPTIGGHNAALSAWTDFTIAGDSIIFSPFGSEKMRINGTGNVGIGTDNPQVKLSVLTGSNYAATFNTYTVSSSNTAISIGGYFNASGGSGGSSQIRSYHHHGATAASSLAFEVNGTEEKMRITSSGNVGIGTTTPISYSGYNTLTINGSTGGVLAIRNASNIGLNLYSTSVGGHIAAIDATKALIFETADIERMRITSNGDFYIGKTSRDYTTVGTQIEVSGKALGVTRDIAGENIFLNKTSSQTGSFISFYYNNGGVGSITTNGSSTAYNTSSDYRLKEDLKPVENALERLCELNPINFSWKATGERVDGFIAHELAEVIPSAVTGEKDETKEFEVTPAVLDEEGNVIEEAVFETRDVYQGIDQSKIVPLLVAAIQEQQEIIKKLTNRITNLENK